MSKKDENIKSSEELELYDDEVQEVIHRVPHWLVRIGATLLMVVIAIVIMVAWIIRYPDVIVADIKITTQNAPAYISSYSTGKIEHLWVQNNQFVKKGEPLLAIENPADYTDVSFISQTINETDDIQLLWEALEPRKPKLGELQSTYNRFHISLSDYINYLLLAKLPAQIRTLENELEIYDELLRNQQSKIEALQEDFKLANQQYKRDSMLYEKEVISDAEFDRATQSLLEKRIDLRSAITERDQMQLSAAEKRSTLQDLKLTHQENLTNYKQSIHQNQRALMADIAIWKRNYLLTSPMDGTVSYTVYLEENMTIRANTELMSVIPENKGQVIGKVNISFDGAGKVKPGQSVNIKLSDYPYLEFGIVPGQIKSLSQVAGERYYVGIVDLPQGLETNNGFDIDYKQDMTGQAEIITNNMRFLERILNPLETIRNLQKSYKNME